MTNEESMRKVVRAFSIPSSVAEQLDTCRNKSEVVSSILQRHIHEIGDGTIEDALSARELDIKRMIECCVKDSIPIIGSELDKAVKKILEQYKYTIDDQ